MDEDQRRFAVLGDFPLACDQRASNVIPTGIGLELLDHPIFKRRSHDAGAFVGRSQEQHVAPVACPIQRVVVRAEKLLDDLGPFVLIGIESEERDFLCGRDRASDVEVNSAEEIFVVDETSRGDVGRGELLVDESIDFGGGDLRICGVAGGQRFFGLEFRRFRFGRSVGVRWL